MNVDNEVLINDFKEEMSRSNNNSKWWNDHLSEQIISIFGSNMEKNIRDAIYNSAKAFINSGALASSQYFYSTKDLNERKKIFAMATLKEKINILNQLNKEDKESLINNNEHLEIKDIYEMLTASEALSDEKSELANLLSDEKITELKKRHIDLDKSLKFWLGERYQKIFGQDSEKNIQPQNPQNVSMSAIDNNIENDNILAEYRNTANKIMFFNNIANIQKKQELFSKLDSREKSFLLNNKNTSFLKLFYNNSQNKEELLDLMNQNTVRTLYNMSGISDKEFISNHLYKREQEVRKKIDQNLSNINKETQNINNYHQEIDKSKEKISNLKNDKKETKLNIRNHKVTIKQLEKRKERLEKKLASVILNRDSRISFISKKRLEKIQRLSSEINLTDIMISNNQERLMIHEQQLKNIETNIEKEKNNIKDNKKNISLATSKAQTYAEQMYKSRVQVKGLSSFHKELVSKKVYNHNKNNMITTINRAKISTLTEKKDTLKQEILNTSSIDKADSNSLGNTNSSSQKSNHISNDSRINQTAPDHNQPKNTTTNDQTINSSKVSQNQQKLESAFNEMGITYHPEEFVANTQNASYLPPDKITSMSYNQAKMMQLYFEAQYAKKMVEIAKMQQEMAIGGRTKTLSKAGFSNILIVSLSLAIISLVGIIMLLIFK